jgi:hypothetical protein
MSLLVSGGSGGSTTTGIYTVVSVIYLKDSNGQTWALTVSVTGNLVTTISSGPAFPFFVLEDSNGVYWRVFPIPGGNLDTTNNGISALNLGNLFITDSSGRNWYISITTSGNLVTT